jgi:hypothetical protein
VKHSGEDERKEAKKEKDRKKEAYKQRTGHAMRSNERRKETKKTCERNKNKPTNNEPDTRCTVSFASDFSNLSWKHLLQRPELRQVAATSRCGCYGTMLPLAL